MGRRVLRQLDGLNLFKLLSLRLCRRLVRITRTSIDSSTTVGIPLGRLLTIFRQQDSKLLQIKSLSTKNVYIGLAITTLILNV